jgi:malonyl CoA-acyl carrier protein transacylase
LLLVAPFAVVEDFADRGAGGGGDFNKIEAGFAGHSQGVRCGSAANFFVFLIDQENR